MANSSLIEKDYLRYVFLSAFVTFLLNKFYLRPFILTNTDSPLLKTLTLSLPNFIEAVMGVIILSGILLRLREYIPKRLSGITEQTAYFIATTLAGIYVITQELKIHNIGGNNIYDPFDLIASLLGLIVTWLMLSKWGFLKQPLNTN